MISRLGEATKPVGFCCARLRAGSPTEIRSGAATYTLDGIRLLVCESDSVSMLPLVAPECAAAEFDVPKSMARIQVGDICVWVSCVLLVSRFLIWWRSGWSTGCSCGSG